MHRPGNRRTAARLWRADVPVDPARSRVFYGWVIVAVSTVGVVASIPGQTIGMAAFTDVLLEALALSRVDLSLAFLLGTLASGLLIPRGGQLLDHWGARRMSAVAALAMAGSLVFLAASDTLVELLGTGASDDRRRLLAMAVLTAGFFMIRFWGQAMLTMACRNMVGKWFDVRRGLAFGITGIATSLLFSASPAFLNFFVERVGWRWTWLGLALMLALVIAVLLWALARDNPEECGLQMDGGVAPGRGRKPNSDQVIHRDYTREEALRTLAFWLFTVSFAWHALFGTAYTFHVVSIGASIGIDRVTILQLFLYTAVLAVLANLACGWLSARTRVKYLLVVMNFSFAVFALGPLVANPWLAKALIVVGMGVGSGLWGNLSGVVFPRFFGRAHLGAITGVFMATTVFASALGPYLFSAFEAWRGDYRLALALSAVVPLLLAAGSLAADNPQRRAPASTPGR